MGVLVRWGGGVFEKEIAVVCSLSLIINRKTNTVRDLKQKMIRTFIMLLLVLGVIDSRLSRIRYKPYLQQLLLTLQQHHED